MLAAAAEVSSPVRSESVGKGGKGKGKVLSRNRMAEKKGELNQRRRNPDREDANH